MSSEHWPFVTSNWRLSDQMSSWAVDYTSPLLLCFLVYTYYTYVINYSKITLLDLLAFYYFYCFRMVLELCAITSAFSEWCRLWSLPQTSGAVVPTPRPPAGWYCCTHSSPHSAQCCTSGELPLDYSAIYCDHQTSKRQAEITEFSQVLPTIWDLIKT